MAAANGHADIAATLLDAGAVRNFVHEVRDNIVHIIYLWRRMLMSGMQKATLLCTGLV